MIRRPSPNSDERRLAIDMIVLHYTGMRSASAAIERLCDPRSKVSAHYVIDEEGRVVALIEESRRAWHAGVASWHGETDINSCSIGIELANPGHEFGYRAFAEPQMRALERLALDVMKRHDISAARVLGHSDVAPERKIDPGELFDWQRLAVRGIGLWPDRSETTTDQRPLDEGDHDAVAFVQAQLQQGGYGIEVDGHYGSQTRAVVTAFQRHFRPSRIDGRCDTETLICLEAWLRRFLDA
ncbi:MAG: N-acetylmuramoyl-L-alanine amidase [Alphaproteobacteria bacterium]|nr:N-acetylmuramoyl-L-alanine amidase [Alphaproteobacteria bacterium]